MAEAATAIPVVVEKKPAKPKDQGTTIAVPPLQVDIVYEEDFESTPLWKIHTKNGLGCWPEESRDVWGKKEYVDKPRLTGEFVEIEQIIKDTATYVLVDNAGTRVWLNVGKPLNGGDYYLVYTYATQKRCAQYGIFGKATVKYQDQEASFDLMAVRAKTRRAAGSELGTRSTPFTLVGPGLYQGYVHGRGKYLDQYGDDGLYQSVSIYVGWQWENDKWVAGIKKAGTSRTNNVFIHPAYIPDWLDGCLALGTQKADWGFETSANSTEAMREVFKMMGIVTKADYTKIQNLPDAKQPKALITVTDNRPDSKDVVNLRIRIEIDPADARTADEKFRLFSTADPKYDKTLTIKDDQVAGDKFVDLLFENVARSGTYTLEIDPGAEGAKYFIFEKMPYSQIISQKKGK